MKTISVTIRGSDGGNESHIIESAEDWGYIEGSKEYGGRKGLEMARMAVADYVREKLR